MNKSFSIELLKTLIAVKYKYSRHDVIILARNDVIIKKGCHSHLLYKNNLLTTISYCLLP